MAVANGRAGRVLARPLFRRLNVPLAHTMKTLEGVRLPIVVQISVTER